MAVCNIIGALIGSRLAISKGSKFVRIFFLVIVCGLTAKLAQTMFWPQERRRRDRYLIPECVSIASHRLSSAAISARFFASGAVSFVCTATSSQIPALFW